MGGNPPSGVGQRQARARTIDGWIDDAGVGYVAAQRPPTVPVTGAAANPSGPAGVDAFVLDTVIQDLKAIQLLTGRHRTRAIFRALVHPTDRDRVWAALPAGTQKNF